MFVEQTNCLKNHSSCVINDYSNDDTNVSSDNFVCSVKENRMKVATREK